MKNYEIKLKGITPLLFNRFVDASIDSEVKKRSGSAKSINIENKLYLSDDGKIYTPSTHINGMLINAGKNFRIQGKSKATYSKIIGSSVEINPDAIIHKIQKWIPFSISAVNPMTKGRMMVTRPMLENWNIEFQIKFPDDIPVEVIKNILDFGGEYVGIGDWRPEKKGKYGKFIVERFEEID
jgi:hypothetical protein